MLAFKTTMALLVCKRHIADQESTVERSSRWLNTVQGLGGNAEDEAIRVLRSETSEGSAVLTPVSQSD